MTEVGSAWVSVLPDAKGFGRKLEGDVNPELDKAGKSGGSVFGGAFKLAAAAGAGIAAVSFLKDAVAEARESQKVAAQTAQVIKTTGGVAKVTAGDVDKLATSISNKTGIDDEAIASASNLLLTFTGVRNEVGKGNDVFNQATQIATDMGAALGTDASGSAIQLGKALNDPVKGITALSRVGVSFTEQQKTQIKTMVAHNDTLGAQKLILGELSKEFGGSAAAQATAGEKAAVAFGNMKEAVGTALLPVLDKLMTFVSGAIIPGLYRLGGFLTDTFGPAFNAVKDAVSVFFNAFAGRSEVGEFDGILRTINDTAIKVREAFDFVRQAISVFFTAISGRSEVGEFDGALRKVNDAAIALRDVFFDHVVPALQAVAGFVVANVLPVVERLGLFFVEHVIPAAAKVAQIIGETLRRGFEILSNKIAENRPQLEQIGQVLLKVGAFIYDNVVPAVAKLAGFLAETLFLAIGKAIGIIGGLVRAIGAIVEGTTAAVNWVRDKFNGMVAFFQGLPGKISDAFHGAFDGLKNAFRAAVNFIIDGWNGLQFSIPGFDPPGPGPKFGGFTLGVPDIPRLADGGIVTAQPGGTLVRAGEAGSDEAVIPLDRGALRLDRRDLDYLAERLDLRMRSLVAR